MKHYFRLLIGFVLLFVAYSCATPISPTGGPPDKSPPEIIATQPQTGTVNFKGDKIVMVFSEYVQRKSLQRALKIEPRFGISHKIDWGKKSISINFARSLPDSTTVIITIGTKFSDLHGNSLNKPFQMAISTGPQIDNGQLIGWVIDAQTGKSKKGKKVLLYRKPVDLSEPANYIAETDTGGAVHFSYLSPGTYKAFWVNDQDRDNIWESDRERAQPFGQEFVTLQESDRDTLGTLYISNSDTSRPQLMGVGLFSSQRMRLRFSENILLTDSTHFILRDSVSQRKYASVYPLYVMPDRPYVLFAHSYKPLRPDCTYSIQIQNITDKAGNVQPSTIAYFTGSSQKDTTRQRIIGGSVGHGMFPGESIQVAYAQLITKAPIRDSLYVIVGDSVHKHWKYLDIHYNKVRVSPDSVWMADKKYLFYFWNPSKQSHQKVSPKIWHQSDLASIHIHFADSLSEAAKRMTNLQLNNSVGEVVVDTSFTQDITLHNLAPVPHQLVLYQDLNGNGEWDAGTVSPFDPPEPYYIRNKIPLKSGFTSDLTVSFHGRRSKKHQVE